MFTTEITEDTERNSGGLRCRKGSKARRFGGTGLGLAISKQLVELMRGRIGVSSVAGRGSRFWFEVPLLAADDAAISQQQLLPRVGAEQPTPVGARDSSRTISLENRPLRVLVAEDNKINQQLARLLLRNAGYVAKIVDTGAAAVAAVRAAEYDVVLMDVQMPVLDGIEATRLIRALPSPKNAVPIIAVTAHAMTGAREQYLASGMNGYLSKPLNAEALMRTLAACRESDGANDTAKANGPDARDDLVFDPATTARLEKYLPRGRVCELLTMFVDQLDGQSGRFRTAVANRNLSELGREAHSLVGSAGNVGAGRLCRLARDLEVACKADDQNVAADLGLRVISEITAAKVAVNIWLERDRPHQPHLQPSGRKRLGHRLSPNERHC